jgi:glycosyltransferase involved in cell wall biosynthesis
LKDLVSIIIPTYNRSHLIGETLDSIIAQIYQNWECIVVDDGSTDYTDELMEFYTENDERFTYYHRPNNRVKGANACRNYGFELSKGEYINWFDSDDIMLPRKLELQLRMLQAKNIDFCVCNSLDWNDSNGTQKLRFDRLISSQPFNDYVTGKIGFLTQAPLWKKKILRKNNYRFDEELEAGQEWELFARVLFDKPNYDCLEIPLVLLRIHNQNISNQKKSIVLLNYWKARNKLYNYSLEGLNEKTNIYLLNYMLWEFKKNLRLFFFENAVKILYTSILRSKRISLLIKIKCSLALVSYVLFKKGNFLLSATDIKELKN